MAKPKPKRRYTDEMKAEALAALTANAGDLSKTAREMNLPRKTLESWARGLRGEVPANMCQAKESDLASRFEEFVGKVLDLTTDDDIKKAPLDKRMVAAGIAVDKAALLRGKSATPGINVVRITEILVLDAEPRHLRSETGPRPGELPQVAPAPPSGPEEGMVL